MLNTFAVESYTSSTINRKEDGFLKRRFCRVSGYARISCRLRAKFLNSSTVLFSIDWRHRLFRIFLKFCCRIRVKQRP